MRNVSYSGRNVDGIILLDKPINLSSNDLLQKVKRLFRANKAGHTGALDTLATGMLPICFGEATKFSRYLLNADKRYLVTAKLGERTDTSDADGNTICVRPVSLDKVRIEMALNYFRGKISQVPSMFSALKYKGRPLYEYARKGIMVERSTRSIYIYELQLHHWDLTKIELEIHCSKGTYIRTIIDDLGEYLGCGAHVTGLRRLTVANYPTDSMVTLTTLQNIVAGAKTSKNPDFLSQLDALLLPIDSAVTGIPTINLPLDLAARARLGQTLSITTMPLQDAGFVRLTEGESRHFFGVGEISRSGILTPRRLITK